MLEINGLTINVVAVLASTIAGAILGFTWYGVLFVRPWAREMEHAPDETGAGKRLTANLGITMIANLLFAWVLAFYLAGWKFIPGTAELGTLSFAINSALSVWIGFLLPVQLSRAVFERRSWRVFLINSGYHLASTTLVALVLVYWA
jgi:hypothetical protein